MHKPDAPRPGADGGRPPVRRPAGFLRGLRWLGACALAAAIVGGSAVEIRSAATLRAAIGSLRSRIVVIDPGHGGIDPGAIAPYGREDAVVTPISEDLARLLEHAGAIVLMTRRRGLLKRRLPMRERIQTLVGAGGDVLISIHANKFFLASEHGATVIYSPDSEPSRRLARMLQEELIAITRETRRPLLQRDDLYMLNHSPVPAVIVEVGFLSNAREARLLAQGAYQQRLAWAMFVGIARWFAAQIEPASGRRVPAPAGGTDRRPAAVRAAVPPRACGRPVGCGRGRPGPTRAHARPAPASDAGRSTRP